MKLSSYICWSLLVWQVIAILGCRGFTSSEPPIQLNRNMLIQEKGKAYKESDFFADGMYMREPIEHTMSQGQYHKDEHFYLGLVNGEPAKSFPKNITIDEAFLQRGQQVYNRTCAACHSSIGDGEGLVGKRLLVKPLSFHSDYMYNQPPGHYFHVITNGIRTMSALKDIIVPADRWAIIAYVRSLQLSQDSQGEWIKRTEKWWKQK